MLETRKLQRMIIAISLLSKIDFNLKIIQGTIIMKL